MSRLSREQQELLFVNYARYRQRQADGTQHSKGLAMAVALAVVDRPLYDSIQGTRFDPAVRDGNIPAFRAWLGL